MTDVNKINRAEQLKRAIVDGIERRATLTRELQDAKRNILLSVDELTGVIGMYEAYSFLNHAEKKNEQS